MPNALEAATSIAREHRDRLAPQIGELHTEASRGYAFARVLRSTDARADVAGLRCTIQLASETMDVLAFGRFATAIASLSTDTVVFLALRTQWGTHWVVRDLRVLE